MSKEQSRELLLDMLGPVAQSREDRSEPLPNVEHRVDLFLRALYGDREFTSAERSAARARILDEITTGFPDFTAQELEHVTDGAAQFAAGRTSLAGATDLSPSNLSSALSAFLGRLWHDLLYPLFPETSHGSTRLRLIAAPLVVIFVASGAWTVGWFNAMHSLEGRLADASFSGRQNIGYACVSQQRRGFPVKAEVRCLEPTVTVADGTYVVRARELVASADVLSAGAITGEVAGPITITENGRRIAVADGDLDFDQNGNLTGMVKFTTTPNVLQSLASALGGEANHQNVAQLADIYERRSDSTDNAASQDNAPQMDAGPKLIDAPVNVIGGAVSVGSVSLGHLPSLFSR